MTIEAHCRIFLLTMGISSSQSGREKFKKILSHHLKSSTDGGGRFQGDRAEGAAMVVVVPNRLLWPDRG